MPRGRFFRHGRASLTRARLTVGIDEGAGIDGHAIRGVVPAMPGIFYRKHGGRHSGSNQMWVAQARPCLTVPTTSRRSASLMSLQPEASTSVTLLPSTRSSAGGERGARAGPVFLNAQPGREKIGLAALRHRSRASDAQAGCRREEESASRACATSTCPGHDVTPVRAAAVGITLHRTLQGVRP